MKNSFIGAHLDFIGFSTSLACALHCAALPFLISVLPLIGLGFLMNQWIEYIIILLGFFLAVFALSHGFWNHHRNSLPLLLILIGFGIILAGLIFGHGAAAHAITRSGPFPLIEINKNPSTVEHFITPIGAVFVSAAHYINWHYIKKSKIGCTPGENIK
ncbi:MerC domain-containing protein [Echinicola salinicaeni]|uniref:MerC domain-containing protein n=1 Tax=Echinicola salinicaeni TaxID=2762757 RepID=UPI001646524C|nr:MerC domain-containing protein [Echinicola salinicaeni]